MLWLELKFRTVLYPTLFSILVICSYTSPHVSSPASCHSTILMKCSLWERRWECGSAGLPVTRKLDMSTPPLLYLTSLVEITWLRYVSNSNAVLLSRDLCVPNSNELTKWQLMWDKINSLTSASHSGTIKRKLVDKGWRSW